MAASTRGRVPHVDEVDRLVPVHRQQQAGEHADAVPDRRADQRRAVARGLDVAELVDLGAMLRWVCTTPLGSAVVPDV